MKYKSIQFISKPVEVQFEKQPIHPKKPGCPDRFVWEGLTYQVTEKLGEWKDFSRKGRMAHNMTPEHAEVAAHRGSWGVGRFYFRVRTDKDQIFDIYYDRAPKDADDRTGDWFLFRELKELNK
jgi:hypothetical protein